MPNLPSAAFRQIEGFGTYGFPESHAASFALLVYVSAWIKCHYPDVFICALLNAQPMGFYSASQLVAEARRSGITVRPADVSHSDWDSTLEPDPDSTSGRHALRLGLRLVKGLSQGEGERIAPVASQWRQKVRLIIACPMSCGGRMCRHARWKRLPKVMVLPVWD